MVGRNVQLRVSKTAARPGRVVLDVKDLVVPAGHADLPGEEHAPAVNGLTFRVRAGEILGIAGVQGNGQTELCEALMGLLPVTSGSVHLNGARHHRAHPAGPAARRHRLRPRGPAAGRAGQLVLGVRRTSCSTPTTGSPTLSGLALNLTAIRETAEQRVKEFDIRTQSIDHAPSGTLSGGNQQKVILAREVARKLTLLMASQPTRGLDVGSIEFVHKRIIEERDQGVAVLLVSSELDEIYALSDRIAIMYEGRFTGFRPPDVPVEELGLLMAGIDGASTPRLLRR